MIVLAQKAGDLLSRKQSIGSREMQKRLLYVVCVCVRACVRVCVCVWRGGKAHPFPKTRTRKTIRMNSSKLFWSLIEEYITVGTVINKKNV